MNKSLGIVLLMLIFFVFAVSSQLQLKAASGSSYITITSISATNNGDSLSPTAVKYGDGTKCPDTTGGCVAIDVHYIASSDVGGVKLVCGNTNGSSDISDLAGFSPGSNPSGEISGTFPSPWTDNSLHTIYCFVETPGASPVVSDVNTTTMFSDNLAPTTSVAKICDQNGNCGTLAHISKFTINLYCDDQGGSGCTSSSPMYCWNPGTNPCNPTTPGDTVVADCPVGTCTICYKSTDNLGFTETPSCTIFGPDVGANYLFTSWIGIGRTGFGIGRHLSDYIYVKNLGKNPDSYTVSIVQKKTGVTATISSNISNLASGSTDFTILDTVPTSTTDIGNGNTYCTDPNHCPINVTITSVGNSSGCRTGNAQSCSQQFVIFDVLGGIVP